MNVKDLTDREAVKSLASSICPMCGNVKQFKNTFCSQCYYSLPKDIRQVLYTRVEDGYTQRVQEAFAHVKQSQFFLD